MRMAIIVIALFCAGCLPATQTEVIALTKAVDGIIPVVREVAAESSQETKDKIEIVLGQVEEINEEVATADDPVEAIEKGWDASKTWNPYYGYGVMALGILRLFQKKKESDNSLEEVVFAIEDAKKSGDSKKTLKDALNATESLVTRKKVAKILG